MGFSMFRDFEDKKCNKNSLSEISKLFAQYNTRLRPLKCLKVILSEQIFVLLLLAPFGTSSQILKIKDQQVFWNILPTVRKDLGPRDTIIGLWGGGGIN